MIGKILIEFCEKFNKTVKEIFRIYMVNFQCNYLCINSGTTFVNKKRKV